MDCSLPGSSLHGIFQAKLLEWVAISYSRGSSHRKGQTRILGLLHWQADSLSLSPLGSPPLANHQSGSVSCLNLWSQLEMFFLSASLLQQHRPLCCSFSPANTFHPQSLCPWCFLCLELCHPEGHETCFPLYFLQIFLQMPPNQWGHPRLFSYSALFFCVTLSPPDVRKSICLGAYMCFPNQNVSWRGGQTFLCSLQCPQFPKHNIPSEIVLDWMNKLAQSVEHETLNLKVVG